METPLEIGLPVAASLAGFLLGTVVRISYTEGVLSTLGSPEGAWAKRSKSALKQTGQDEFL
jgi:hypothetical protein